MTGTHTTYRVFISSPGDVGEEREQARRVVAGLQRHYPDVTLQPVLWEELALPATASFQESIDFILERAPIDIAVFILWSRLGSPLGAAVTKPDGSAYRSGTEREFDLMLTAFEQSERQRPVILAYAREDDSGFKQRLTESPESELSNLIEQRALADAFIREQFRDAEGHNLRAYHSYTEPIGFAQRLRVHLRQILDDLVGVDAAPRWLEDPYRGLRAFDVKHSAIFHGRDEETCDLLQRLRDQRRSGCAFVVIVGASGSGKSSLARAGVAATLVEQAGYDEVKQWRSAFMIPALGADSLPVKLIRELADVLPELVNTGLEREQIAAGLVKAPELAVELSIAPAFARAAEQAGGPVRLLIVLDQMEELWTDRRITCEEREQFLLILEALAHSGHVSVLATLRSDFYPQAQQMPTFLRLKGERGQFDLLPPGPAALARLITEPARLAGLRFEQDQSSGRSLDQVILEEAVHDPGALPLLQYALDELYRSRDQANRRLTFAAYDRLGGVEGALGKRAEEVFANLPKEAQAALPEILPLLITVDIMGDQAAVRCRAPLTQLTGSLARQTLISSLIEGRFLTTDMIPADEIQAVADSEVTDQHSEQRDLHGNVAVATLAHEALLQRWQRVADWITSNREQLRLRARVEQSQRRWQQTGKDPSLLLSAGLPLEEGRQLLADAPHLLSDRTREYVCDSIESHELHNRRVRRRRQVVVSVLGLLTLAALIGGGIAVWQKGVAEDARDAALAATLAEAEAREAEETQRELAENNAHEARNNAELANSQRKIAEDNLRHTRRLMAEISLNEGLTRCEQGEIDRGLLWFARGLSVVPEPRSDAAETDAGPENALRANFTAWSTRLHHLRNYWSHPGGVSAVRFSPDGKTVLTTHYALSDTARLWDVKTGDQIGRSFGNAFGVMDAVFSPDGKWVLTAGVDKAARLWDAATGKSAGIRSMRHDGEIRVVAFSPDGNTIVTGSADNTARLWDAATGKSIGPPLQHDENIRGVAFHPDGKSVVTACDDDTARLWDVASGKPIGEAMQHKDAVVDIEFSPNGKTVVTASTDNTARLWDGETGKPVGRPMEHLNNIWDVAFSPDGKRIVTASADNTARQWDASGGAPIGEPMRHGGDVYAVAFSPDGTMIVTGSEDKSAQLWRADTGQPAGPPLWHRSGVHSVTFSPDGDLIATGTHRLGSGQEAVRLWNVVSGGPLVHSLSHDPSVYDVALSRDGKAALSGGADKTARLWRTEVGQPLGKPMRHEWTVMSVAISPDGKTVLTGSADKTARLWDAASQEPIGQPLEHQEPVDAVEFSPDGSLALTVSRGKEVRLWDAATGEPVAEPIRHTKQVSDATFSPDGKTMLTAGGDDKTARLWSTETGKQVGRSLRHDTPVSAVAFSPDGNTVLTGTGTIWFTPSGSAQLWNLESGKPLHLPLPHMAIVREVAYSPNGSVVITASDDKTARLWDVATGQPLGLPLQHEAGVRVVAFSHDGKLVATGSSDGICRLWDVAAAKPIGPALTHDKEVTFVGFSPDGQTILTGSKDGTVRLWRTPNPAVGEPENIQCWSHVVTGLELDETGVFHFLDPNQWTRSRAQLLSANNPP